MQRNVRVNIKEFLHNIKDMTKNSITHTLVIRSKDRTSPNTLETTPTQKVSDEKDSQPYRLIGHEDDVEKFAQRILQPRAGDCVKLQLLTKLIHIIFNKQTIHIIIFAS
jgi:hypothetical protein